MGFEICRCSFFNRTHNPFFLSQRPPPIHTGAKMKWTPVFGLAVLGFSGASASANPVLGAKFNALSSPLQVRRTNVESIGRHNATTPNFFGMTKFLTRRQAGRCGPDGNNARCTDNRCCSAYGWCGTDPEHCAEIVGCQPEYGRCGDAPPPPSSTSTPTPSSTPVPSSSSVPPSSTVSSTSSAPLPSGTLIVSPNGQCGNSTTCAGSGFGGCCSEWYFCGNDVAYCGTGCRSAFGRCDGGVISSSSSSRPTSTPPPSSSSPPPVSSSSSRPSSTSSSATPTPTVPVSTDGRCGNGVYCTGSTFGRCCSDYFWCGNDVDYCSPNYGCRPEWGTCGSL